MPTVAHYVANTEFGLSGRHWFFPDLRFKVYG
jgi:hypothetical protein